MDSALYASMHVLDVNECNTPRVCDNVSMSDDPHDCDAMLHQSLGVIDIPNINLWVLLIFLTSNSLRKMLRSFKRI